MKVFVFPDDWFIVRLRDLVCDDRVKQMVHSILQSEFGPASCVAGIFRCYLLNYTDQSPENEMAEQQGRVTETKDVLESFDVDDAVVLAYDSLDVICTHGIDGIYDMISSDMYEDFCSQLIDTYGEESAVADIEEVIQAFKWLVSQVEATYLDFSTSGHNNERIIVVERPHAMAIITL